jgi:hypothetical protein
LEQGKLFPAEQILGDQGDTRGKEQPNRGQRLRILQELVFLSPARTDFFADHSPMSTAGGLVFIGAARDSQFRAFDTKTGRELWSVKTQEVIHGNPIAYMGKDGKQYIAVAAGSTLLTYKLP